MHEPYFEKYLRRVVPVEDPIEQLASQGEGFLAWAKSISTSETKLTHPPYTWTLGEVLKHLSDCERVFAFRALWLARGSKEPLPSFDENLFLENSAARTTPWEDLIAEYESVRLASITLFKSLPSDAWTNRRTAAGFDVDVNMLYGMIYGHLDHHFSIMKKRVSK